ncbi:DUF4175 family protein [Roseimicrobium sp. ORNL1]|uniref:DUF4175 family protein n=1 Tax=Roseimicrobium sp. ORNL1 TaxID=2711231 RepID=UPI0013E10C0D|nr:DUF4175 family protein [Roseimicrobium sp. ORNL1]QIF02171.1 hypothetical protein G5S37_11725 [Roseimicrobium sp. ORNL1]
MSTNTSLRPATLEAIGRFRQRRKKLLLQRAWMTAAVVLLVLLLVVAIVDRLTFMADGIRQWLSYAAYAIAAIAAWWLGLRMVRQAQDVFIAARLMENADARMHEKLLSAVELSKGDPDHLPDSPEFRALLQDDVAKQLEGFDAAKVLPSSLNRRWLVALCSVLVLIAGLSFVGGLHLPGFLARAALPFANIGRPSSTKVRIVTPPKGDALVAIASSVSLGVQIDGKIPNRILVETVSNGGRPSRMELSHAGVNRFDGSIGIGQQNVRYRVLAGDAITAWHTLEARPRPRIVEFQKKITPPAYTGLKEETITEDHGDISALEGSKVTLVMKANQPIETTKATLLPDIASVNVTSEKKDVLTADITVNGKADAWQLALTAQETKFTNEEASPWRIETIPDLPPAIVITQPREQLEVRSDDAVQVLGHATDDVGLKQCDISYAINGADWKDTDLKVKPGKEAEVSTEFRLAPLPVKPGDTVLVKLAATDVKGQRSESTPVRLLIVEDKLDLGQRQFAAQQRRLAQQALALAEETVEMRREAEKVRDQEGRGKDPQKDAESDAAKAKMKQSLASVQEKSKELWEQLKQNAQQAPNPLKAMEANLVGQRLAELQGMQLKEVQDQLQSDKLSERQLRDAAGRAANAAEVAAQALKAFAAADTAQAACESFEHLAPQQNRLSDKAIDANRKNDERAKWQEQQRAALASSQSAKKDFEALKEVLPDNRKRDVAWQVENLEKKNNALEASLDREGQHQSPEYVYGQSQEMRNAVNQARDVSRAFADEAAQKANEMRERLTQQQNPALASIDAAQDNVAKAFSEKKRAEDAAAKGKEKPQKENPKETEPQQEQAAEKLAAAARQFKDQSELREQNHQTNTQAALDMNRMGRALDKLAEKIRQDTTSEQVKETLDQARKLADAARTLQADAMAQDAAQSLQQAKDAAMAQTDPGQQVPATQAAANQLKQLPEAMHRLQQHDAANAAQEAAGNAQWQRDETQNQRRQMADMKQQGLQPQPINPQQNRALEANAKAEAKLAEAMEKFSPKVAEARQNLEAMTPKLSELAKNTASQLQRSQEKTEQTAQAAQNNEQTPQQTSEKANALMPQAKEDAQKLADLQAALRQEADKADLNNELQRQMARTADVGLAQMRQQTPQITQNLQQAANASQAPQQAQALQTAAKAQQQTADGLKQLAENLQKMEKGEMLAQDALAAQEAMEKSMNIEEPLDKAYDEAKNIAELMEAAEGDPQKALQALEAELKRNPQMQRALGALAEQTAQNSQQQLAAAQNQPFMTQPAAENSAHDLARVARHEERLGQKEAAKQVAQAGQKLQQMADAAKADPGKNTPQTAQAATQTAQNAQQAAAQAAKNQSQTIPPPSGMLDTVKSAMLAQALDQLDQTMNPKQSQVAQGQQQSQQGQQQQGQQQQGQQTPQGQQQGQQSAAQQGAQQSLSQASQAQAQGMAQARAQGMVPGQQPAPGQQMAQQPGKNQEGQQSQASPDANGKLSVTQTNLVMPVLSAEQAGDWGHLPSRMAKDLTEASRQEPSPEYRAAIESYYKAIAEKAKK